MRELLNSSTNVPMGICFSFAGLVWLSVHTGRHVDN
jgi:hypothetical protein